MGPAASLPCGRARPGELPRGSGKGTFEQGGVNDDLDNCPGVYNRSQVDCDWDGVGNACDEDCPNLDGSNPVGAEDFSIFADAWLRTGPDLAADLNRDGIVDINDLAILAAYWLSDCHEERDMPE